MVSFQPSEDQQLIRDTVASFAQEQIRPAAHEADETGAIPSALIQQGWGLGLVQSVIPEAHGGAGEPISAISGALVAEELAWGDLAIALHLLAPRLLLYPIILAGTPEQQQRILPAFGANQFRAATAAVMEPRFGFDLAQLSTTAQRSDGSFTLSGAKCFVPIGGSAEQVLVYARTSDGVASGFLVDKGAAGIVRIEREQNMGIKALETTEMDFDKCTVPAANQLACDFPALMNRSRVGLAALAVGVARAAFEYARDYAKDRKAFGVAIAQKQAIAFMLAEMAIEIDATRLLAWEAAWKIDRGEDATREAVLAKHYAASMVMKVTDNAVQVLGGHGYIREHPVELWARNGRGIATFEGLVMI
ncbi:MAG: acyl-CoA dehydrogenase family protein [Deltaproteobacteria bacterium]|nr:acyl-CoA dehydrogenase family protein [Deltaproteobacteria bacterium]MBI3391169.1 acyl-CoA dehydrogenase family protein [Deltaproteobacteria bacterium]